jgi:diadenosine tetraphosphate (Ap4A) HIT family hydrolase
MWWLRGGFGLGDGVQCVFCQLPKARIARESDLAILVWDAFPVSNGHALAIPKRHVASWFDTTEKERCELLALIDSARIIVKDAFVPQAFNIGINDGVAAGQTIPHLHVHLIPRYEGDVLDPRGGVRWILPDKAVYWDSK